MISPDNYDKFVRNAEEQNDSAGRGMNDEHPEGHSRQLPQAPFRQAGARAWHDVEAHATGNGAAANYHWVLAEIYRLMLDNGSPVRAA